MINDKENDVLYLRNFNERIITSALYKDDGDFILNYGNNSKIIGVQLIGIKENKEFYKYHEAKNILSKELNKAIDEFIKSL